MTGMKEGAGEDPFAEGPTEESADQVNTRAARSNSTTRRSESSNGRQHQPYIVRRAIQDEGVQWERPERLTFFVHRDVAEGERELVAEMESTLSRDLPKFDVREAAYRAALANRDDVLNELLEMGYELD